MWLLQSIIHSVLLLFNPPFQPSYQKSPGQKFCLPERTELLVKESPAYREKGEGGKRGLGNVAEKWVRKASLEAKVLGN